jgi:hypothetical protein
MRTPLLRTLAVTAAAPVLMLATALPAAAAPPTLTAQLGPTLKLVAGGAAVDAQVTYTCSSNATFGNVAVRVTEAVANGRTAQGVSFADLKCDGARRTARLTVVTENGFAYRPGVAFGEASLFACDANDQCATAAVSRTVRIVK